MPLALSAQPDETSDDGVPIYLLSIYHGQSIFTRHRSSKSGRACLSLVFSTNAYCDPVASPFRGSDGHTLINPSGMYVQPRPCDVRQRSSVGRIGRSSTRYRAAGQPGKLILGLRFRQSTGAINAKLVRDFAISTIWPLGFVFWSPLAPGSGPVVGLDQLETTHLAHQQTAHRAGAAGHWMP